MDLGTRERLPKYVNSVSNGTSALEVIIRVLKIAGKFINTPTNTFLTSALTVAHSGNKVVFADPETLSLDPDDVAHRIRDNTGVVTAFPTAPSPSLSTSPTFLVPIGLRSQGYSIPVF